ncbi:MAG: TenA family protein [Pseudomonadota bacterium]
MTDYGSSLFAALREECASAWRTYTEHAFVAGLGDGSLPREAFLRYLRQDYLFLVHLTRAWALAVVKSDRIDEMRHAAATVHALIDEEMRLHIETCAAEGISEAELAATTEARETLAYTRFVIDAGLAGDLLDLLVALSPCVFGYGEIGTRLMATRKPDTPYHDWIETYAGDDYQAVCREAGVLLESVARRKIGTDLKASPRWPQLAGRFGTACELEAAFWGPVQATNVAETPHGSPFEGMAGSFLRFSVKRSSLAM